MYVVSHQPNFHRENRQPTTSQNHSEELREKHGVKNPTALVRFWIRKSARKEPQSKVEE